MHDRWLKAALRAAHHSPDPNTKVGAVIVRDHAVVSIGWNDLPGGIDPSVLTDRARKLEAIIHAEQWAICNAAAVGRATEGATLYIVATDDTGETWGGPPCTECLKHVIAARIKRVVAPPQKAVSRWRENLELARVRMERVGMELVEVGL